jgi:predicted RNA methylase
MTLVSFGLLEGRLPPTIIDALWRGSFSVSRKPFVMCYNVHHPSLRISEEERKKTCEYLQRFGRTREEQVRTYYLWAQTVPRQLWRYFTHLPLTQFSEIVADMVPPYAISQLLVHLDVYYYFKDAVVLDLFAGVCGWLMAFAYLADRYKPRRWVAVDIDGRRLQVCRMISRDVGVDVETVKRDLNMPYVSHGRVDVVVGSPPCHEFSVATVSRAKRIDVGLQLVHSYLRSVELISPLLAVMEEATTTGESQKLVTSLVGQYGFSYSYYDLRDFGAIQNKRMRLIAWKISK